MRIKEITEQVAPLLRAATPAIIKGVKTVGQMASLALRIGLPVAVTMDVAKEVFTYATTDYPDDVRRDRALHLMEAKISVIIAGALTGMGVAQIAGFYATLGLSALSKTIQQLTMIAGGTVGAELAAHSDFVAATTKVVIYSLHPHAAYLDTKDEAVGFLTRAANTVKSWFTSKPESNLQ